MISRRDQVQSYQFRNQRVISAFVMRETDPTRSPLRHGIGALFGGLMVAVLVAAGFGVHGLLTRTGTDRWQQDGSVVVERETGASFVYLRGRLHPALNFASAKLASGRPDPQVFRIAAKSLAGTPRGVTIGIAGAPASLPGPAAQTGLPWAMCAVPAGRPQSVLLVGGTGPAAESLADRALLVTDQNTTHLIWQGRRHRIPERTTVVALFGNQAPVRFGAAWLNALPSGADIAPLPVPNLGDPSAAAPGFDIGDILVTDTGSGQQFNLVLDDGRVPVTAVQQVVLSASPGFGEPRTVDVSRLTEIPESRARTGGDAAGRGPDQVPRLATVRDGESACAITRNATDPPDITVGGPASAYDAAVAAVGSTAGSGLDRIVDRIQVPGGRFALVRAPGSGAFTLVTDIGLRHLVPNQDALARLGYTAAAATDVPAALVDSIPPGVTLDPEAATRPAANPR